MPTYVYETIPAHATQKPRQFEVDQRMSAAPLTHDPETGLPVRRIVSGGLGFIGTSDKASSEIMPCGRPMGSEGCGIGGMCGIEQSAHHCTPGCEH